LLNKYVLALNRLKKKFTLNISAVVLLEMGR